MGDIIKTDSAYITASSSVVGSLEKAGPLGEYFDIWDEKDDTFGKDSWEKSESEMQRLALKCSMEKAALSEGELDVIFAGDLINQCISSGYGLVDFDVPFLGIYGACSTCAEGLLLSSVFSSYTKKRCAAVTSSHNCSAERQFRFPVEYGSQRTPTSQWTVTGAASFIVSPKNDRGERVKIIDVMAGKSIDAGITDVNNMGAAMAPAAADTIQRYLTESKRDAESFDCIVTGDLGLEGSSILLEIMKKKGFDISSKHRDCGVEIYDIEKQDMHAGGSGCGCSGVTVASYFTDKLKKGEMSDILFVGTGALMNAMSLQQGNSIPGIGHLVHMVRE